MQPKSRSHADDVVSPNAVLHMCMPILRHPGVQHVLFWTVILICIGRDRKNAVKCEYVQCRVSRVCVLSSESFEDDCGVYFQRALPFDLPDEDVILDVWISSPIYLKENVSFVR